MTVMQLDHPRVGVTKVLCNNLQRRAVHPTERGPRVAQLMEPHRFDLGAETRGPHGALLLTRFPLFAEHGCRLFAASRQLLEESQTVLAQLDMTRLPGLAVLHM